MDMNIILLQRLVNRNRISSRDDSEDKMPALFQGSFHDVAQARIRSSVDAVKRISRSDLLSPKLDQIIQSIVDERTQKVPSIETSPEKWTGIRKPKTSRGYALNTTELTIQIPFKGSRDGFQYGTSRVPVLEAEIGPSYLVFAPSNESKAKEEAQDFVRLVAETLDQLRSETEINVREIRNAVQSAIEEQKRLIEQEMEKDKALGFPIRYVDK